jgi:hypothetical protein
MRAANLNHEAGAKRSGFCVFDCAPEWPFVDGSLPPP